MGTSLTRASRRYAACARMHLSSMLVYRWGFLLAIFVMLAQIFLLKVVWTAVYAGREQVDGVPLETMIAYATLAMVQFTILNPWRASPIPERIREGKVAADMLRPVGFPAQMLSAQFGGIAAMMLAIAPAVPLALLVGAAKPPSSTGAGLAYVAALAGAIVLNQLIVLLLNLICFWTTEVTGIFMIYRFVMQFFSGALLPLWFMPGPIRFAAELMPFQASGYVPTAIYLGEIDGEAIIGALVLQLAWIVALIGLIALVWSRAIRRVVIQGG